MHTFNQPNEYQSIPEPAGDSSPTITSWRIGLCLLLQIGCTTVSEREGSKNSANFLNQQEVPEYFSDTGQWQSVDSGYSDKIFGCDVPTLGTCHVLLESMEWDPSSAIQSCNEFESQLDVSTVFIPDPGCSFDNVVGICNNPDLDVFPLYVLLVYDQNLWNYASAEADCNERNGDYFSNW